MLKKPSLLFAIAGCWYGLCTAVSAQTRSQVYGDELTKQAQTLFLRADTGMTTFESKVADSKETQPTSRYTVGGWAGEARLVGGQFTTEGETVHFDLNNSDAKIAFQDLRMLVRIGWLMPSLGLSFADIGVTQEQTELVGLYSTGVSAGLNLAIPLYYRLVVSGDAMTVRSNKTYDKLGLGTKLVQRDEFDANIAFDLTERIVDLLVGYRVRRFTLANEEQSFGELSQGAYAGLRFGIYF